VGATGLTALGDINLGADVASGLGLAGKAVALDRAKARSADSAAVRGGTARPERAAGSTVAAKSWNSRMRT
jgi:hypothetical protein